MTETVEPQDQPDIQPDQVISPDDWYDGIVDRVTPTFWFVTLNDGSRCFVPGRYITDRPFGHMCSAYIKKGMRAALRIQSTPEERSPYKALEAVLDEKIEVPEYEFGEIASWDDGGFYGYISRQCGCHIFGKIIDRFPQTLLKGDRVRFRLVNTNKGWSGQDVELIKDSGITEEKQ